ncbi:MAG TPA: M6 family metalloprotease domain-containing protein [Fibrobacter sp.]|nr:M6 family metalloprotease domain-containing protein [Fibrobacter sp.]
MKSSLIFFFALAGLVASTSADIVWKGKRVSEWPAEALPEMTNQKSILAKTTVTETGMGLYPRPTGVVKGLTLVIDFSDQPAPASLQDVDDWLNKPGFNKNGCNGSVRDYYKDASNGKIDYQNTVLGFYRAKKPKSYYDDGEGYERATELLNEVLDYFDPQVNFADYDNDGDGNTEAISIVYAGAGATWGKGIWPHSGWIGKKRDGVNISRYMMTDLPGTFSLYVFAHESGHMVFGWPDLYWFGDYCLMANRMNDKNPVVINDFFRADQGWIPFADVDGTSDGVFTSTVNGMAYRYKNPNNSKEGFFWCNIANTGRYSVLKGSGLLLFHYNLNERGNTSATNLQLRTIQADNKADLQAQQWPSPGNASNDLFRSKTTPEFSASTSDYSAWYDGSPSNLRIWDISNAQTNMTFKLGLGTIANKSIVKPTNRNTRMQQGLGGYWNLLGQREKPLK